MNESKHTPSSPHAGAPRDAGSVYGPAGLLSARGLFGVAVIGVVIAGLAGAFAYTGGFLSAQRLTPAEVVSQFETTNGVHPGFRRNHPKGVCFSGWFDSDGAGQRLSRARVFAPGRIPMFGRFAIASGQPYLPDTPTAVHSMAVNLTSQDGEVWRMAMNGVPVFPAQTVQDLYDQLVAAKPDPATGKPDPARLAAFVASHPATARATAIIKSHPLASGFANTTYNGLDAFIFEDANGQSSAVRWSMVAQDAFIAASPGAAPAGDPNYQFTELAERVRRGPVSWHLVVTVARPGDPTNDPTVAWPAGREQVQLGTLTIDRLEDEAHGACRDVTFDPLILPAGIRASDDPILSARSATYAQSLTRRSGEPAPNSAVTLPSGVGAAR